MKMGIITVIFIIHRRSDYIIHYHHFTVCGVNGSPRTSTPTGSPNDGANISLLHKRIACDAHNFSHCENLNASQSEAHNAEPRVTGRRGRRPLRLVK